MGGRNATARVISLARASDPADLATTGTHHCLPQNADATNHHRGDPCKSARTTGARSRANEAQRLLGSDCIGVAAPGGDDAQVLAGSSDRRDADAGAARDFGVGEDTEDGADARKPGAGSHAIGILPAGFESHSQHESRAVKQPQPDRLTAIYLLFVLFVVVATWIVFKWAGAA